MKKYSKPFINNQELIEDIYETLYLYSGSDYIGSPCYPDPGFEGLQRVWSDGLENNSATDDTIANCTGFTWTVKFDTTHEANPEHSNHLQYIIFQLTYPSLARDIGSMTMDSTYTGYFNGDYTKILFETAYNQNAMDRIGSGGVKLNITFAPNLTVAQKRALFNNFSFNDTFVKCGYYITSP